MGHTQSAPTQFTDLASVFQMMSVQQSSDNTYYMDSRATSHMSFNLDNKLSLIPCNSKSVIVGNGDILPVTYICQTFFPHSHNGLALNDVLLSNKMVKNLIFVCRFIVDTMFMLHLTNLVSL